MGLVASAEEDKRCQVPRLAHGLGPTAQAPAHSTQGREEGKSVVEQVAGARGSREEVGGIGGCRGRALCALLPRCFPSRLLLPSREHPHPCVRSPTSPAGAARLPNRSLLPALFVFRLTSLSAS